MSGGVPPAADVEHAPRVAGRLVCADDRKQNFALAIGDGLIGGKAHARAPSSKAQSSLVAVVLLPNERVTRRENGTGENMLGASLASGALRRGERRKAKGRLTLPTPAASRIAAIAVDAEVARDHYAASLASISGTGLTAISPSASTIPP